MGAWKESRTSEWRFIPARRIGSGSWLPEGCLLKATAKTLRPSEQIGRQICRRVTRSSDPRGGGVAVKMEHERSISRFPRRGFKLRDYDTMMLAGVVPPLNSNPSNPRSPEPLIWPLGLPFPQCPVSSVPGATTRASLNLIGIASSQVSVSRMQSGGGVYFTENQGLKF